MEFQNEYKPTNPSYPLMKRGVYYVSRNISAQLGAITETTDYSDLAKTISIWIVNNGIPKELENTVTRYSFKKEDIVGISNEPEEDYDLMEIIVVKRGKVAPEDNDLFQYLEGVFSSNIGRIKKYIDIPEGSEIENEVVVMSGFGQAIALENYEKGIEKGIKALVNSLKSLLSSPEDILNQIRKNDGYEDTTMDDVMKYY